MATARVAQVIDDHEVVLDAAVGRDPQAVEHFDDRADRHLEAGFLAHFPSHGVFERLAELHASAGQAPLTFERLVPALDQQDATAIEDDRPDAHDWTR